MLDLKIFWYSIRPHTLLISISPTLLGSFLAFIHNKIKWLISIEFILCFILLQVLSNVINDYYDVQRGTDLNRIGDKRPIHTKAISPQELKYIIFFILVLVSILGLFIMLQTNWWILFWGVMGITIAIFYTATSFSLSYHGFGELTAFIIFGPLATCLAYYANTLTFNLHALLLGLPLGGIAQAVMLINNIRDYPEDKKKNKKTLTVRIGLIRSKILIFIGVWLPLLIVLTTHTTITPILIMMLLIIGLIATFILKPFILLKKSISNINLTPMLKKMALLSIFYTLLLAIYLYYI